MENSHNSHSNGNLPDSNQKITRHPRFALPWFDIRVFYARISSFQVDDSTPEYLTLTHIPLTLDTVLEVNGIRCPIDSEGVSCVLRRDRMDKKSEEATFVSTDNIRLIGNVKFEVVDKNDVVLSGVLEMNQTINSNGGIGEFNSSKKWSMDCESVICAGMGFLKGKHLAGFESSSPTIEVYVAGCVSGNPIILTKTLQISPRKKVKKGGLNTIPEYDDDETREDVAFGRRDLQVAEYKNYKPESDEDYNNSMYYRRGEYMEVEDGELSWFNAGVRVGVGIGLGICLGVGVGVGLLVRTYQTTTRTFRRRLI